MERKFRPFVALGFLGIVLIAGCRSPYRSDQGALFGGLLGAGTGAVIGEAMGNTGAGAALGAGVGAISGAAIGGELDQIEAQNRAMIESQLGRQIAAGSISIDDVVAMTHAGVNDELIVAHIQANGFGRPLRTSDLIFLQQQGVGTEVVKAMQQPPRIQSQARLRSPMVIERPAPVIVEQYHCGAPTWPQSSLHWRRHHPRHESGFNWGLSFHN